MTELFSHGHFVDHVSGSLQKFFNDFLILKHRGWESVGTPFGLNSTVLDYGSGFGEDTLDQFGSNIQRLCASCNAIRSKSIDCSFILGPQIHSRLGIVGDGVAADRDDRVGDFPGVNGRPGLESRIESRVIELSIRQLGEAKNSKSSNLQ